MKRRALLLCVALLVSPVFARDEVTRAFSARVPQGGEVLVDVEHKALVSEYLDPLDTGIGKDLAQLLWHETLSAISDQAGAGVILAKAPEEERLVDLLEKDYHRAAIRIAEQQSARMVLWGAAFEQGGQVYVNSHVSLISATQSNVIRYRLGRSADHGPSSGQIELQLPRTKFNFPTVARSRAQLFERPVILRATTNLREAPTIDSRAVGQLLRGATAQAVNVRGDWFEVSLENGERAFVIGRNVHVTPREIEVDRRGINLRAGPAIRSDNIVTNTDVRGRFAVLDQRYTEANGLWYRIRFEERAVWISATLVEPLYSLPVVHFVAGLHRYFGGRYRDADAEFQRFLDYPGASHTNVNRSVAYQYQALSDLLGSDRGLRASDLLRKSMELTPYDATPYTINALTLIGTGNAMQDIRANLNRAQALDPRQQIFEAFEQVLSDP